jgi:hypothetical protein
MTYPDGSLTPAGVVYKNNASPIGYVQEPSTSTNTAGRSNAYLPFDGDTLDASGHGHNGQVMGAPDFVAGQRGQALEFDGVDNQVRLPENVARGNEFSFAGWVYWDGGGNWQRIFDFGNGTTNYLFLTPSNGSNMRFAIKNGGAEQIVQTGALPIGQWTHVAVTLGGGAARLYVNGALAATNSAVTIRPGDFDPAFNYLGESQYAADPLFRGRLDDVIIRDTMLTQSQIAALMTNTAPQFSSNTMSRSAGAGPISGTIAGSATDADAGDIVTYAKVNGPAWLTVAADGTLSGTPSATSGIHEFVVTATDSKGMARFATLNIQLGASGLRAAAVPPGAAALAIDVMDAPTLASLAGAAELLAIDEAFESAESATSDRYVASDGATVVETSTQAGLRWRIATQSAEGPGDDSFPLAELKTEPDVAENVLAEAFADSFLEL